MQGKELIRRCKDREKLKKYLVTLHCLGNTSTFIVVIDLMKQRDDALEAHTDASEYKDYKEIQRVMQSLPTNNEHRRISRPVSTPRVKEERKFKEITGERHMQSISAAIKSEEPYNIDIENDKIICNFDYACIISTLAQKAYPNNVNYREIIGLG